ncbi:LHFPL tetraspan subfamily member 2 protein [Bacillus rossius redtenbacheri]|uniref:LHFPL tetraspan subfamily member 2 protein n=1 Tax=Bacillus rossius redtenbacheri TaxID=93214 RepID=UPI002FDED82F
MCYVIITARSLLWTLLTLAATLALVSAVLTPRWLVGPRPFKTSENGTAVFFPSVGVYSRCVRLHGRQSCGPFAARGLATDPQVFPPCWKAALVFLAAGLAVMALTVLSSVLSSCVQSVCRKSIFTLSGAAQAVAGIFFILGIMLHPAGWGSPRVQKLCGYEAAPFYPAECSLGWAFYSAVGGVALTFLCSVLSVQAELATSSDKVQFQIHQGHTLICLP